MSEADNVIHVAFGQGGGRIEAHPPLGGEPLRAIEEREDPLSDLYSATEVGRLFAVNPSRLRYWDRTRFVSPSGRRGRRRYYTFQDLIGLRAAKALIDSGVPLQRVRRSIEALRELLPKVSRPLSELRITAEGHSVVVRDADGQFDAGTGQGLLNFDVCDLRDDVVRTLQRHRSLDEDRRTAYELYLEGCRLDEDATTFDRAEEMYRRALQLDPSLANALTNLGNVRFRRGFAEEAAELYKEALAIDGGQPEAHYNLGFIYYERGDPEASARCFQQAVEADPGFADAHFNLAMALEEIHQRSKARRHWRLYLQLEPDGSWAEIARRHLAQSAR